MKKIISVILKFLATGAFTLVLAACYGPARAYKLITALSSGDSPIPGLKVTLMIDGDPQSFSRSTDEEGKAIVDFPLGSKHNASVRIEDRDGPANGGSFQTRDVRLDDGASYTVHMNQ